MSMLELINELRGIKSITLNGVVNEIMNEGLTPEDHIQRNVKYQWVATSDGDYIRLFVSKVLRGFTVGIQNYAAKFPVYRKGYIVLIQKDGRAIKTSAVLPDMSSARQLADLYKREVEDISTNESLIEKINKTDADFYGYVYNPQEKGKPKSQLMADFYVLNSLPSSVAGVDAVSTVYHQTSEEDAYPSQLDQEDSKEFLNANDETNENIIEAISKDIAPVVLKAQLNCYNYLKDHMLEAVYFSLSAESRHIVGKTGAREIAKECGELNNYLKFENIASGISKGDSHGTYAESAKAVKSVWGANNPKFANLCFQSFKDPKGHTYPKDFLKTWDKDTTKSDYEITYSDNLTPPNEVTTTENIQIKNHNGSGYTIIPEGAKGIISVYDYPPLQAWANHYQGIKSGEIANRWGVGESRLIEDEEDAYPPAPEENNTEESPNVPSDMPEEDETVDFKDITFGVDFPGIGVKKVKGYQVKPSDIKFGVTSNSKSPETASKTYLDWGGSHSSYGGNPWAKIAEAWLKLNTTEYNDAKNLFMAIDNIYDLQHNNDTVFTKVKEYSEGGYEWLKEALEFKYYANTPQLLQKCSPSLKEFASYVYEQDQDADLDKEIQNPVANNFYVGGSYQYNGPSGTINYQDEDNNNLTYNYSAGKNVRIAHKYNDRVTVSFLNYKDVNKKKRVEITVPYDQLNSTKSQSAPQSNDPQKDFSQFSIGDKVKYKGAKSEFKGQIGTITALTDNGVNIKFPDGGEYAGAYATSLEKVGGEKPTASPTISGVQGPFKIGDLVVCVNKGNMAYLTVDKTYKVLSTNGSEAINVKSDQGNVYGYPNELFKKVTQVFKVGDKVECIDNDGGDNKALTIGKIYVVEKIKEGNLIVVTSDKGVEGIFNKNRFKLVSGYEEVPVGKNEPKFQKGDQVVVTAGESSLSKKLDGQTVTVDYAGYSDTHGVWYSIKDKTEVNDGVVWEKELSLLNGESPSNDKDIKIGDNVKINPSMTGSIYTQYATWQKANGLKPLNGNHPVNEDGIFKVIAIAPHMGNSGLDKKTILAGVEDDEGNNFVYNLNALVKVGNSNITDQNINATENSFQVGDTVKINDQETVEEYVGKEGVIKEISKIGTKPVAKVVFPGGGGLIDFYFNKLDKIDTIPQMKSVKKSYPEVAYTNTGDINNLSFRLYTYNSKDDMWYSKMIVFDGDGKFKNITNLESSYASKGKTYEDTLNLIKEKGYKVIPVSLFNKVYSTKKYIDPSTYQEQSSQKKSTFKVGDKVTVISQKPSDALSSQAAGENDMVIWPPQMDNTIGMSGVITVQHDNDGFGVKLDNGQEWVYKPNWLKGGDVELQGNSPSIEKGQTVKINNKVKSAALKLQIGQEGVVKYKIPGKNSIQIKLNNGAIVTLPSHAVDIVGEGSSENAPVETKEFPDGAKVKYIGQNTSDIKSDIGTVLGKTAGKSNTYDVQFPKQSDGTFYVMPASLIELVEETPTEQNFKVGDKVKVVPNKQPGNSKKYAGQLGTIEEINGPPTGDDANLGKWAVLDIENPKGGIYFSELQKVETPPEKEEEYFKVGDSVDYIGLAPEFTGQTGKIAVIDLNQFMVQFSNGKAGWVTKSDIKKITSDVKPQVNDSTFSKGDYVEITAGHFKGFTGVVSASLEGEENGDHPQVEVKIGTVDNPEWIYAKWLKKIKGSNEEGLSDPAGKYGEEFQKEAPNTEIPVANYAEEQEEDGEDSGVEINDEVQVLKGKDKGKTGLVLSLDPAPDGNTIVGVQYEPDGEVYQFNIKNLKKI